MKKPVKICKKTVIKEVGFPTSANSAAAASATAASAAVRVRSAVASAAEDDEERDDDEPDALVVEDIAHAVVHNNLRSVFRWRVVQRNFHPLIPYYASAAKVLQ